MLNGWALTPDKEECFFCGNEVTSKDGRFIEVMTPIQDENKIGLKIQMARWACNKCIVKYKGYLTDGK